MNELGIYHPDHGWFVKYDEKLDKPVFTEKEDEAGKFVMEPHSDPMSLMGNLYALSDRFGIKALPKPL